MIFLTFALLLTFNYYPSFMGLYRAFFNYDVGIKPEFVFQVALDATGNLGDRTPKGFQVFRVHREHL